jgi:hypothetical protein
MAAQYSVRRIVHGRPGCTKGYSHFYQTGKHWQRKNGYVFNARTVTRSFQAQAAQNEDLISRKAPDASQDLFSMRWASRSILLSKLQIMPKTDFLRGRIGYPSVQSASRLIADDRFETVRRSLGAGRNHDRRCLCRDPLASRKECTSRSGRKSIHG